MSDSWSEERKTYELWWTQYLDRSRFMWSLDRYLPNWRDDA